MIHSHLLYQTELSFVVRQIGIEPMPSGFIPMLSMSYNHGLHSAEHETGDRPAPVGITTSPNPWPKRRSAEIKQASRDCKPPRRNFSSPRSTVAGRSQRAAPPSAVIARKRSDEAIHLSPCGGVDCFASLALTWKEFAAAYQVRHLPRRLRPYWTFASTARRRMPLFL
jgi:hypothetical protein